MPVVPVVPAERMAAPWQPRSQPRSQNRTYRAALRSSSSLLYDEQDEYDEQDDQMKTCPGTEVMVLLR